MREIPVYPREYLDYLRWKFILRILYIYAFTGVWAEPSHPFIRSHRLCFSSSAVRGTLVGKHLPLHY